jgi:HAD superfamily hydrolase (TIGR01509 family)
MIQGLTTIVFDLGAVLYDIDYRRIEEAFAQLQATYTAVEGAPVVRYSRTYQPAIVTQYEVGEISTEIFRTGLRKEFHLDKATTAELDSAWNAILVGLLPGRIELLQTLKQRFRLGLLSNTNALHIAHIADETKELFACFDTVILSHLVGMRKPSPEIFLHTLTQLSTEPHTTLFIDDSPQHIESATALGIHTLWLPHHENLTHAVYSLVGEQNA